MTEEIPEYRRGVKEVIKKVKDDQFGRERWEVEYEIYDRYDEEDEKLDQKKSRTTKTLQARNEQLGIEDDIGKKRMVVKEGPKKDQAGFHCPVCDENFMDSISWIDHLNSQKHNRLLGMNMQVEKVNSERIKQKFAQMKNSNAQIENYQGKQQESIHDIEKKLIEEMKKRKEKKQIQQQRLQRNFDNEIDNIMNKNPTQNKFNSNRQQMKSQDNNKFQEQVEEDEQLLEMQKFGLPTQFGSKKLKK